MFYLFVVCAVLGGTIMICQMVLTLIGLAGESLHVEVPHGTGHEFGGDLHGDAGGDLHGDAGGDLHGDVHADAAHAAHADDAHGSMWMFKALSFRTLVAATAFFGLAGLAANAAELAAITQFAVALAAGIAAMYGVFWMMQTLYRLRSEGTVRVQRAIGREATVYLRIPAQRLGAGKVLVDVQNRTMEYSAMTGGPELPTGVKVVVVDVISPDTLEVKALDSTGEVAPESERKSYV